MTTGRIDRVDRGLRLRIVSQDLDQTSDLQIRAHHPGWQVDDPQTLDRGFKQRFTIIRGQIACRLNDMLLARSIGHPPGVAARQVGIGETVMAPQIFWLVRAPNFSQ